MPSKERYKTMWNTEVVVLACISEYASQKSDGLWTYNQFHSFYPICLHSMVYTEKQRQKIYAVISILEDSWKHPVGMVNPQPPATSYVCLFCVYLSLYRRIFNMAKLLYHSFPGSPTLNPVSHPHSFSKRNEREF